MFFVTSYRYQTARKLNLDNQFGNSYEFWWSFKCILYWETGHVSYLGFTLFWPLLLSSQPLSFQTAPRTKSNHQPSRRALSQLKHREMIIYNRIFFISAGDLLYWRNCSAPKSVDSELARLPSGRWTPSNLYRSGKKCLDLLPLIQQRCLHSPLLSDCLPRPTDTMAIREWKVNSCMSDKSWLIIYCERPSLASDCFRLRPTDDGDGDDDNDHGYGMDVLAYLVGLGKCKSVKRG